MFRRHVYQGVTEFLRGKTGWVGDPHELSIVSRPCADVRKGNGNVNAVLRHLGGFVLTGQ